MSLLNRKLRRWCPDWSRRLKMRLRRRSWRNQKYFRKKKFLTIELRSLFRWFINASLVMDAKENLSLESDINVQFVLTLISAHNVRPASTTPTLFLKLKLYSKLPSRSLPLFKMKLIPLRSMEKEEGSLDLEGWFIMDSILPSNLWDLIDDHSSHSSVHSSIKVKRILRRRRRRWNRKKRKKK